MARAVAPSALRRPMDVEAADLPPGMAFVETEAQRRAKAFLDVIPRVVAFVAFVVMSSFLYYKWDPNHYKAGAVLKLVGVEVSAWDPDLHAELTKQVELYNGGSTSMLEDERNRRRSERKDFKKKLREKYELNPKPPSASARTTNAPESSSKGDDKDTKETTAAAAAAAAASEGGALDAASIKAVEDAAPRQI